MDVSREWKRIRRGEWQCGPFYVTEFVGKYDVWFGDGLRLLKQNLASVADVKRWLKDNRERLAAEGYE